MRHALHKLAMMLLALSSVVASKTDGSSEGS